MLDRPIHAKLIALILTATVGWPWSLDPLAAIGSGSAVSLAPATVVASTGTVHYSGLKKCPQRHHATVMLDTFEDDPAIAGIEPEDWLEICTFLAPIHGAFPSDGAGCSLTESLARLATPSQLALPKTIESCRFQC